MIPAYAAWCRDGADAPRLRDEHLAAHLAHVDANMDKLLVAGPLKDETGAYTGSLIVFGVESPEEAWALMHEDPITAPASGPKCGSSASCRSPARWSVGATVSLVA